DQAPRLRSTGCPPGVVALAFFSLPIVPSCRSPDFVLRSPCGTLRQRPVAPCLESYRTLAKRSVHPPCSAPNKDTLQHVVIASAIPSRYCVLVAIAQQDTICCIKSP